MSETDKRILEDAQNKKNHWDEEAHINLPTVLNIDVHISRIRFVKKDGVKTNKRCISITKNRRSVAFDIEMCKAVAAAINELGDDYA